MDQLVPAAEYVRMSTEDQQYSIANQREAIQAHAKSHAFIITHRYEDAGKSGRTLKNRWGLRALLQAVTGGTATFRAVLVYDVSRWGRFEDMDEAAHYEFLCCQAGIQVHYCAEPFANDGSFTNNFFKAVKRVMAGEYSRDMSYRMYSAKTYLSEKGYWMGANPGCGLRRCLLSADGTPKGILSNGERKYLMSDRVILVPGPADEVACVREIFRMALKNSARVIATELNEKGRYFGKPWTLDQIKEMLRNPKYTGKLIWGKTKVEVDGRRKSIPEQDWHSADNAVTPIVSRRLFNRVQCALDYRRTPVLSDEELMQGFRKLIDKHGVLTASAIAGEKSFRGRFARRIENIRTIYESLGLTPPPATIISRKQGITEARLLATATQLARLFPELTVVSEHRRVHLRLQEGTLITLRACRPRKASCQEKTWDVLFLGSSRCRLYLLCFYGADQRAFESYALVDAGVETAGNKHRVLHPTDPMLKNVFTELLQFSMCMKGLGLQAIYGWSGNRPSRL